MTPRQAAPLVAVLLAFALVAPLWAEPPPAGTAPAVSAAIPTRFVLPAGSDRAVWEASGAPVVLVLPDHLGLDERAAFHIAALLEGGVAALLLDLPPAPGVDKWSRGLIREPERDAGAVEALLPPVFEMLGALDAEQPPRLPSGRRRAIGLLGFGTGGEAAALAAHEAVAQAFLPEPGAPRFRAHALLYPTCHSPMLDGLRRSGARTTGAPVLVVLAHAGGPGEDPVGCGVLFDWQDRAQPDPFIVRAYSWMYYGFDLWPAAAAEAARLHLPFPGGMDPIRFDAISAELARRNVAAVLLPALAPAPLP